MRDYKLYLEDILRAADNIDKYTKGLTLKNLKKNNLVVDAVVRNLEIIGEAAKNIPVSIRNKSSDIEWRKISGLRNILVHEYFGVDLEILWDVIQNELPSLRANVSRLSKETKRISRKKRKV